MRKLAILFAFLTSGASAQVIGPPVSVLQPGSLTANNQRAVTANTTVLTSDCGNQIVAGGNAFYTLTLPAPAGFPANCVVSLANSDTGRGKALSGFPAPSNPILWPTQTIAVENAGGAWRVIVNPGRWVVPGNTTFNIDNVNGNNANDGLATGTGNALLGLSQFNTIVTNQLDTQGAIITALLAGGQSWTNLGLNVSITGGGTVNLHGNGGSVTSSTSGVAAIDVNLSPTFGGFSNLTGVIQGFTVTCSSGGNGLLVHQGYVSLFSNMTFGACANGYHIGVDTMQARLLLQANYSITGGAANHLVAIAGLIDWNSASFTATLTGTPAFTGAFAFSEIGGNLISFNVWSGAATGPRYLVTTGGNIYTAGGGANFFPGNSAGSANTGGNYDLEWQTFTPSYTCGTATFTNNSSRWRSLGKTTLIAFDFTTTAIGTCTNTVTFTAPTTANGPGTMATVEVALNGLLGICRVSSGSATANCFVGGLANFLVNERFVGSGIYENQ